MNHNYKFELGDDVEWTSGASGFWPKRKRGIVVEIVPVGTVPDSNKETVGGRKHESYVVRVGKKLYWPRVCHLKKVVK